MRINDSITLVKGVGPELAKKYQLLGIRTVGELIDYLPRRYDDYSVLSTIDKLQPGLVTVRGAISRAKGSYVRRGMHITEAVVSDAHDSVRIVWFNQPYRAQALKPGQEYFVSGNYELSGQRMQLMNPSVELVSDFPVNTARIVPIYKETKGLTSRQIRKAIGNCLSLIAQLPETLPAWLIAQEELMDRSAAVRAMHFPASSGELGKAQRRLGFEEVFELSLASLMNREELARDESLAISFNEVLARQFVGHLPFHLTSAQRKVVWQLYKDMQAKHPMNRLIEGDVGSGKTVVATMAALMVMEAGYQVALMAPTEILARQHADTIFKLLEPLGLHDKVCLLVGSMTAVQKAAAQRSIRSGHAQCIIGTHALIQTSVDMHKLGLVVVDEQHRFGVEQRKTLMSKAGHMPHLLSLTATPIPRSLALTLYGEMSVSILDEKPPGRQPIVTELCSPNSRAQLYTAIKTQLQAGRQMFVVCPLIQDSASLKAESAEATYALFRNKYFKEYRIGLLHGKLKPDEKTAIMEQFKNHELDILVSTTVIEVGVDVPNASVMLVQSAERFGLAQIHQLRGRIGRGGHKGYCYLMLADSKAPSKRLRALESSNDGFRLAELDLQLRGPGAIYGQMQHGVLDLRVAKLTDAKLIASARAAAEAFIRRGENLLHYKLLASRVSRLRAVTNLN